MSFAEDGRLRDSDMSRFYHKFQNKIPTILFYENRYNITMNITGRITGIKYAPLLGEPLPELDFAQFDVNNSPSACVVHDGKYMFALSKWVSPKRSRSYPFGRVYNTLEHSKKITVIPVVKDEGKRGDRDYIQWDTVSLMSLLDVFVIFAYYDTAEVNPRNKQKITRQQFNAQFVKAKIKEIEQYHSSALHWNLNELKTNFHDILNKASSAYRKIEEQTGVTLHSQEGLERFREKIGKDVADFMEFSRHKSEQAQKREVVTLQPKERLQSATKATITIRNYLGGAYFLTVDEIKTVGEELILIESKHSKNAPLPSLEDIKDGLLKMILFGNLTNVMANDVTVKSTAMLVLTSPNIKGTIHSQDCAKNWNTFLKHNDISVLQRGLIQTLFEEANRNNFVVEISNSR